MKLLNASALYNQHAFQNWLPIPDVIDTRNGTPITLQAREFNQFLGLYNQNERPLDTTVWGYGTELDAASYPGPTILAYEDRPVTVTWQNKLPLHGHLLPVDYSLHIAQTGSPNLIPIVTHLHEGHSDSIYDGLPDQWFTQDESEVGPKFVTSTYTYANDQPGSTLWYHDHTLGMTRLNVYAGLAGFYLLQDKNLSHLEKAGILPGGAYDLGMAIQDRAFTSDGQLYYPAYRNDVLPGQFEEETGQPLTVGDVVPQAFYDAFGEKAPSAVPEFFGDTILVNGMAWPKLAVAAGDYKFRLLNGSDSRFYVLKVDNPDVSVHLVGTDGGLLRKAQTIIDGDGRQESNEYIVLAPGDRVELVFDFSQLKDDDAVRLQNVGPASEPFKGLTDNGVLLGDETAAGADDPVGNIMQFEVNTALKAFDAKLKDGTPLARHYENLARDANHDGIADKADHVRKLGLFEGTDDFGRVTPILGTAEAGSLHSDHDHPDGQFGPLDWEAPTTEKPLLGSTEQWDLFNFTADSHPIHLHLVRYQVVEKRHVDYLDEDEDGIPDDTNHDGKITYGTGSTANYKKADIWIGDKVNLRPEETGWQDTVHMDPFTVTSIVATFDKPGDYVWHCHILSHEDNEMMRPFTVVDPGLLV